MNFIYSVVVIGLHSFSNFLKRMTIFWFDISQCNSSGSFLMYQLPEPCLPFHDTIWHSHFAAKSWQFSCVPASRALPSLSRYNMALPFCGKELATRQLPQWGQHHELSQQAVPFCFLPTQ